MVKESQRKEITLYSTAVIGDNICWELVLL